MRFDKFFQSAKTLIESQYHWDGDYEPETPIVGVGYRLSNRQLSNGPFSYLGELDNAGTEIKLYTETHGDNFNVLGYYPINEKYNDRIFFISLKRMTLPNIGEVYSVTNVQTDKKYRMGGLAATIYAYLVHNDHIILSDRIQYDGAVALWKSLATNANAFGVSVTLLNMQTGEQTKYDGSNIPDDEIWGKDLAYHANVRLILAES